MKRIMALCGVVLAVLFMTACSQETDRPTPAVAPPSAEPVKQVVEEVQQKVVEAAAVVEAEVTAGVEAAKEEGSELIAQAKTSSAAVVDAVPKLSLPVMKTVAEQIKGPGLVTYEASKGTITFDHAGHSGRLDCSACHTTEPPRKIDIDKVTGHALCKGCHQKVGGNAPKSCSGCHQK